jgi:exodeoxyribonuclease III
MKVATFNINNVNKRLANLLAWLRAAEPDVVCLQELKATDREFPITAIEQAGYGAVWRGQKSWNGVAILARGCEPVLTRAALPGDPADEQGRYIEAAVQGVLITSLYAPNGNPQPGPKFDYKLAWLERLARHAGELYRADVPVVLAGDYNVVPTDFDIYPTKSYAKDALHSRAFSSRAGPMRSDRCILPRRCIRSGTTCAIAGRAMPGCGSITCCSARRRNNA